MVLVGSNLRFSLALSHHLGWCCHLFPQAHHTPLDHSNLSPVVTCGDAICDNIASFFVLY